MVDIYKIFDYNLSSLGFEEYNKDYNEQKQHLFSINEEEFLNIKSAIDKFNKLFNLELGEYGSAYLARIDIYNLIKIFKESDIDTNLIQNFELILKDDENYIIGWFGD